MGAHVLLNFFKRVEEKHQAPNHTVKVLGLGPLSKPRI